MPDTGTTTRFVTRNYATKTSASAIYPLLKNSPLEDADFPASNLLRSDRYVVWHCPGTAGGTLSIDIDLGPNPQVAVWGFLNLNTPQLYPYTGTLYAGTVYPFDASWVQTDTFNAVGMRDYLCQLPSVVTKRYWRLTLANCYYDFWLSKLVLGSMTDLGRVWSPGSVRRLKRQRVHQQNVAGLPLTTVTGPDRYRWELAFNAVNAADRSSLMTAVRNGPVPALLNGVQAEVDLVDDEFVETHVFGPPDLYDIAFALEQLP